METDHLSERELKILVQEIQDRCDDLTGQDEEAEWED